MRAWLWMRQRKALGLLAIGVVAGGCGPAESELGQTGEAALALVRRDFPEVAPRVDIATAPFIARGRGFAVDVGESRRGQPRLDVVLPERAEDAITMSIADGFVMTVRELDAAGAGRVDRGLVTYPRADGTAVWVGADDGAEEWLYLPEGTTTGRIASYRVTGGSLRQHFTAVDIYDERGRARVTVSAPGAWGANGEHVPVWMEAEGDTVVLRTKEAVAGALLVDPAWVKVGSMGTARRWHTASLLPSGNVLVAGGEQQSGAVHLDSAEIYDHLTKTWFPTAPMTAKRRQHCSVILPDGRVFVGCQGGVYYNEIYDEMTGSWFTTADMQTSPSPGAAVMLEDGRLLMTGGTIIASPYTEAYDPVSDTWGAVAPTLANRTSHATLALPDGRVLIVGGNSQSGTETAEVYDPILDIWSAVGSMARGRGSIAPLVPLQDGRVLVAGGYGFSGSFPDAEIFDPSTNQWTSTTPMAEDRYGHRTLVLDDGRALVVGGASAKGLGEFKKTTEIYDPATGAWAPYATMIAERTVFTLVRLQEGRLLVAGGDDGSGSVKTAESLGGITGEPCNSDENCVSNVCSAGICCATECPDLPCGSCAQAMGAPENGTCALFQGVTCDDGNACTLEDRCSDQGCAGQAAQCPPPGECEIANSCAQDSGTCASTPVADGSPCLAGACMGGACVAPINASSGSSNVGTGTTSGGGHLVGGGSACNCRVGGGPENTQQHLTLWFLASLTCVLRRTKRHSCGEESS